MALRLTSAPALPNELAQAACDQKRLSDMSTVPLPLFAQSRSYCESVKKLVRELDVATRHAVQKQKDERVLSGMATQLLALEQQRRAGLAPLLSGPEQPQRFAESSWAGMLANLRRYMVAELEALRDARLRLELHRAELINQQAAPKLNIVLQGGSQVRLHFQLRQQHSAKQTD